MEADKAQRIYMSKNRRLIMRIIILSLIIAALAYTLFEIFDKEKKVTVGDTATPFVLESLEGEKVALKDFRGKGVLLNFWGTWCDPCKEEMPAMNKAYKSGKVKGVEIVAVNIREAKLTVKNFAERYELKFPILLDYEGEITNAYGVWEIPTTFLIDENGVVQKIIKGPMTDVKDVLKQMKLVQPEKFK